MRDASAKKMLLVSFSLTMILLILLSACAPQRPFVGSAIVNEKEKIVVEIANEVVYRFHDKELKVTCWAFGRSSISCLPDLVIGRR